MANILKYKEIYNKESVGTSIKCGGEFKIIVRNSAEDIIHETDWFKNTLLDYGLSRVKSATFLDVARLGDSDVATVFTMTGMQGNPLGGYAGYSHVLNENPLAPDYTKSTTVSFRFGSQVGNIKEVVICIGNGATDHLTNGTVRVVVSPSIPITSDQIVDVFYKFTVYPLLTDGTGTVDIGGVTYNWTSRMLGLTEGSSSMATFNTFTVQGATTSSGILYNGALGSLTDDYPTGSSKSRSDYGSISSGDYYRTFYSEWGLDSGNFAAPNYGKVWRSYWNLPMSSQIQFLNASDGSGIPKDADKVLTLVQTNTWARH